ncbi:MAG TPA: phosphate signaling complex protein PhoU [Armatimonadota bacterium]|nr:phosphate signaling complex protein PhoU [Armatimonadota bacterium]HOS44369.1 phosphate signaling complex protein PhoU [Armatimonadota bacterium]
MPHPRQTFDAQLRALEQRLLRMGGFVEGMLEDAVKALAKQDTQLAEEVVRRDDVADEQDIDIESTCMHLLALQQPLSKDLRVIGTALKITTDLERIGDYSVDIAKAALILAGARYPAPLTRIPRMAEYTVAMVQGALEGFVHRDFRKIEEVIALDDKVDALYVEVWEMLLQEMRQSSENIVRAANLILVARYLERIADHAVNVAERVYYMETGVLRQLATSHQTD